MYHISKHPVFCRPQVIWFIFSPKPKGYGRRETVEHLLAMGANVLARDDGGLIPLHNACSFGHAEVVSLLLQAGADPNAKDSWSYTPLHEAAIKGKVDVCIMLLQHGADPSIRNSVRFLAFI